MGDERSGRVTMTLPEDLADQLRAQQALIYAETGLRVKLTVVLRHLVELGLETKTRNGISDVSSAH